MVRLRVLGDSEPGLFRLANPLADEGMDRCPRTRGHSRVQW